LATHFLALLSKDVRWLTRSPAVQLLLSLRVPVPAEGLLAPRHARQRLLDHQPFAGILPTEPLIGVSSFTVELIAQKSQKNEFSFT
jgi:hypothetical protein